MTFKDLDKETIDWLREDFVGNECDTDEYRETQPSKGLGMVSEYFFDMPADTDMIQLTIAWLNTLAVPYDDPYTGSEELKPILVKCFNRCVELNMHPYQYTAEEALAHMKECQE